MMTTAHSIDLRAFDAIGGFLGQRFSANHEKRLAEIVPDIDPGPGSSSCF